MFDYMTKISLGSYNTSKVEANSKMKESLTASKVMVAERTFLIHMNHMVLKYHVSFLPANNLLDMI